MDVSVVVMDVVVMIVDDDVFVMMMMMVMRRFAQDYRLGVYVIGMDVMRMDEMRPWYRVVMDDFQPAIPNYLIGQF